MNSSHTLNVQFQQYLLQEWKKNQYITYYAFTVSPRQIDASRATLEQSVSDMQQICKNIISCKYIYEISAKTGKHHIHGILASKSKSKHTKLNHHPLVKFHIVEYVNNNLKWIHYMSKDKPDVVYAHYRDTDGQIQKPKINLNWFLK